MKDQCFLLPAGWPLLNNSISVRRTASMGDCIASTVVADRLIELGFDVTFVAHAVFLPLLKLHPKIRRWADQNTTAEITLDNAYEQDPRRTRMSFSELFIEKANAQLASRGVRLECKNCRPCLRWPYERKDEGLARFAGHPKPWVIINPRAAPNWAGRHVPTGVWVEAAKQIQGTCFWLGQDPAPPGMVDLQARTMEVLPAYLWQADYTITPDTGPLHLAAALGKPVLGILQSSSPALHLSDQADWDMVGPPLNCLNCQKNVCPINATRPPCQSIDPALIAQSANRHLSAFTQESVSCVIPIYKPPADRLNRCLEAVLPQVSEVIITVDQSGTVPKGVNYCTKVKLVQARLPRIGVGPNMNHGARHTSGKYILLLNDDVMLAPDAVARLMDCMKPGVGMVGQLLYYPDRTIAHGGKYRPPGAMGWGHIDHRKFRPTITAPVETENVTGASILVRREAFYQVAGFDERYFLYCEDDDLCMKFRQAGWKIFYTPLATAIHEEGQSTRLIGDTLRIMRQSQELFARKWSSYFRRNTGPGLGTFL